MFITIEGGEGSGKTTLLNRLYDHLTAQGQSVIKTREPGGTPLGEQIRHLILHAKEFDLKTRTELFLFLADRAQHIERIIKPAIEQNQTILCDRFTASTIAPDLTFFVDIDPPEGLRRVLEKRGDSFDRIESETIAFHAKVREAFLILAERNPDRIKVLNGNLTPDEVFNAALECLSR